MKTRSSIELVVLLALGACWFAGCRRSAGDEARFETMQCLPGDVIQHVSASGTLSAVVSVDVGSQVSGKISNLTADFNSPVRKGQLVAEIDPTVYEAALKQAEGEVASAAASLRLKQQNWDRKKVLTPLKAASQWDLDQATAQVAEAEALVAIKQAARDSARANLGYCKITAPVDGVVIARKVDVGQTVIAAMNTPLLFTVAQDLSKMHIKADVSEADIGQVREGQKVDFTVDAFPDEVFHGVVTQVRRAPTTIQNVVTYETMITVENPSLKLFPGMTADVSIMVASRMNVVKIPNAALRYTPPEGVRFEEIPPKKFDRNQRLVYVVGKSSSTLRPVLIRTGITDGEWSEVLEGLEGEDMVVTSTAYFKPKGRGFAEPPAAPRNL